MRLPRNTFLRLNKAPFTQNHASCNKKRKAVPQETVFFDDIVSGVCAFARRTEFFPRGSAGNRGFTRLKISAFLYKDIMRAKNRGFSKGKEAYQTNNTAL